jgi:hypothetical protein
MDADTIYLALSALMLILPVAVSRVKGKRYD